MRRLVAISVLGVTMLITTVIVIGSVPIIEGFDLLFVALLYAGLWLYGGLGVVIIVRADGHVIGWLFALSATMMAVAFGCLALGFTLRSSDPADPLIGWLALAGALLWAPAPVLLLPAVALAFPTGTLPGPSWRGPVALVVALVVVQMLAILMRPGEMTDGAVNPLTPWLPPLSDRAIEALITLEAIGLLAVPLAAVLGVAAILIRFRTSRGGERQQMKWFLSAAIPATILLPISVGDFTTIPLIDVLSVASLPLVAMSIAVAILRYRLYEIDRIISRTIAYGLVSAIVAIVFGGVVVLLSAALSSLAQGQTIAVAASTLAAVATFQPVLRRVRRDVDRRFDRARYDSDQTVASFSDRLRDQIDLAHLRNDLDTTIRAAIAPKTVDIWLRESRR